MTDASPRIYMRIHKYIVYDYVVLLLLYEYKTAVWLQCSVTALLLIRLLTRMRAMRMVTTVVKVLVIRLVVGKSYNLRLLQLLCGEMSPKDQGGQEDSL